MSNVARKEPNETADISASGACLKCVSNIETEVDNYVRADELRRAQAQSRGLPFALEMMRHLLKFQDYDMDDMATDLHDAMPWAKRQFWRQMMDLIVGDDPEVHHFRLDRHSLIKPHSAKR